MRRKRANQARVRSTTHRCLPRRSLLSMLRRAMRGMIARWRSAWRQWAKSYPLSACSLAGRRRGRPAHWRIAGTASTTGSSNLLSCRLAGEIFRASGKPLASKRICRLEPGLPRSVGFGPVSSPPPFCWDGGAVHRSPFPVDGVGIAEPVEQHTVQPLPDASLVPFVQSAPTGHARTAAHLHRQQLPGNTRAQHEQDASQRRAVVQPRPPALRLGRLRREQRLNQCPKGVGDERCSHAPLNSPNAVLLGALTTSHHP